MDYFISDLDDVLVDMVKGLINAAHKEHDLYVPFEEWHYFDFRQYPTLTKQQILELHMKYSLIDSLDVFKETRRFLKTLKENNIGTIILTSRSWHPEAKEKTQNYLRKNELDFEEVIISNYAKTKGQMIQEISKDKNVIGFVDDNMDNAKSAVGVVDKIYLMDRPWNKICTDTNLKRIKSVDEILLDLKIC